MRLSNAYLLLIKFPYFKRTGCIWCLLSFLGKHGGCAEGCESLWPRTNFGMLKYIISIRDILPPTSTLDIRLSIGLIEATSELRKYLLLELFARISRPSRIPSRKASPAMSLISSISGYSGRGDESGIHTTNGFSEKIISILGLFFKSPEIFGTVSKHWQR